MKSARRLNGVMQWFEESVIGILANFLIVIACLFALLVLTLSLCTFMSIACSPRHETCGHSDNGVATVRCALMGERLTGGGAGEWMQRG